MAREAADQLRGAGLVEAFFLDRRGQRPQTRLALGHRHGADHAAEHEPVRRLVLRSVRPGELRAADEAVIDGDRIRPDAGDRLLRRRARDQRVGQRRHAGVERAPRGAQRLVGLQHDREFGQDRNGRRKPACPRRARRRSPWRARRRRRPRAASPGETPAAGRAPSQTACSGVFRTACGPGLALSDWDHYNLARVAASGGWPAALKAGAEMAEKRTILVCSCEEHHAARRRRDCARLPRRAGEDRKPALPRRDRAVPRRCRKRRRRSPSAARRRRRCSPRSPASDPARSPSSMCARPPAGRRTPPRPGRRWRRCSRSRPSRCPKFPLSASTAKASR